MYMTPEEMLEQNSWLYFDEPHPTGGNARISIRARAAAAFQQEKSEHALTDAQALHDFLVVNYAVLDTGAEFLLTADKRGWSVWPRGTRLALKTVRPGYDVWMDLDNQERGEDIFPHVVSMLLGHDDVYQVSPDYPEAQPIWVRTICNNRSFYGE